MKKMYTFTTAVLVILLSQSGFAQVGSGFFLGGSVGFNSSKDKTTTGSNTVDGPKSTDFMIAPSIGYFFTENIGAGVRFGYSSSKTETKVGNSTSEGKSSAIGAELFIRYASMIGSNNNFAFVGELSGGFGSITSETSIGGNTIEGNPMSLFGIAISPGVIYFPAARWGFEASIGNLVAFSQTTEKDANDDKNKEVNQNFSIIDLSTMGLNLGFHYYFNR